MTVVIGSASIRVTAISADLKRDISRDLNEALRDVKIDINPLQDLDTKLRSSELELIKARQAVARFEREAIDAEDRLGAVRRDATATADDLRDAELRVGRAHAEANVARDRVRTITASMTREQERYRQSTNDTERDSRRLHSVLSGIANLGSGIGRAFGAALPSMHGVSTAGTLFTSVLRGMAVISVVALGAMGALAGAGGLGALASALATASGAALILPAALGAAGIAVGALIVGFQGMGDAFKAMGDPAKFAEAIKELSPNARAFAIAVHDMVPAFKELRTQVQDRLFAGLGKDFSDLGKIHLPIVQKGLSDMAVSLNLSAKGFVAFARDKQTVADLGTLFKNSSVSAGILSGAVQPLLGALRDIGVVGSSFLPALADGLAGAAQRFGAFIANARETGKLQEWISAGLSALGDLFTILGNIGSIIGSVFKAGQDAGAGFLNTAREVTGELAAWAKSTAGQSALGDFFAAAKQAAQALLPIVGSVVELIGHQLAPILAMIATTVGPSVKIVLDSIGDALDVAKPGIEALAQGFASFLAAVAPALPAVGALVAVLGTALGTVLTELGPVISEVATVLAGELGKAIPLLVPGIVAIATALGEVLVVVAPLLPPLAELASLILVQLADILTALAPTLGVLVEGFGQLVVALSPLIEQLGGALVQILEALAPVWPALIDAIVQLVPAIVQLALAFLPLLSPLAELIGVLLPPLIQLLTTILVPILGVESAILSVLVPALTWLLEVVVNVISGVVNWFTNLGTNVTAILNNLGAFFTGIWNFIKDTAVNAIAVLVNGVRERLSSIGNFFSNAFGAARDAVSNAFVNIKNAVSDGINTAVSWVSGLPGRIMGALGDLGRLLWDAGVKLITGLLDGIKHAAAAAFDFVKGIGSKIASLKGPIETDKTLLVPAGLAIMTGLHEGLAEGFRPVEELVAGAAARLAQSFGTPILRTGLLASQLPPVRTGAPSVPAPGGDGAASPADLQAAILAAISDWQVIISARETASKVNRVNKDNATR
jgi:phage-related protein